MSGTFRPHPLQIIYNMPRASLLLIFPAVRTLRVWEGGFSFSAWAAGALLDVAAFALILAVAAWRRRACTLSIEGDEVVLRDGALLRRELRLTAREVSATALEQGPLMRLLGAERVYIDCRYFTARQAIRLAMREEDAEAIAAQLAPPCEAGTDRCPEPESPCAIPLGRRLMLALLGSNSFAGVLLFSTFLTTAGQVLGADLQALALHNLSSAADRYAALAPRVALTAAAVVLAGWLLSFVLSLIASARFSLQIDPARLDVRVGAVTERRYRLRRAALAGVVCRQSPVGKLFRVVSISLPLGASFKARQHTAVVMPATPEREVPASCRAVDPEFAPLRPAVCPPRRAAPRYLAPPFALAGAGGALFLFGGAVLPPEFRVTWVMAAAAVIAAAALAAVRLWALRSVGLAAGEGARVITVTHLHGRSLCRSVVRRAAVQKITVAQSAFSKSGLCDVRVYGVSYPPAVVWGVDRRAAERLLFPEE